MDYNWNLESLDLRKFLLQAPWVFHYEHDKIRPMRDLLRSYLFRCATANFQYLSYMFDGASIEEQTSRMERRIPPTEWIDKSKGSHSHCHPGRPCVLKLSRGEPTHRCLTCGIDDTCVLCKYCFNPADHEGHNVFVKVSSRDEGGICDCGDNEAWKKPLRCLASQNEVPEYGELPLGFVQALEETLAIALDYVIDVLSSAHPAIQLYDTPEQFEAAAEASELDPEVYGERDMPLDGKYVLNIWHDDKRSFSDCQSNVELATQRSPTFSRMIGKITESYGRATVSVSDDLNKLLEQKRRMKLFACTIRTTRDHFREEMVDEIIHWISDLTQFCPKNVAPTAILRLVGKAMLDPWRVGSKYRGNGSEQQLPAAWAYSLLKDGTKIPSIDERIGRDHSISQTSSIPLGSDRGTAPRIDSPAVTTPEPTVNTQPAATQIASPQGSLEEELLDFDQGVRFTDLVSPPSIPGEPSTTSPLWNNCVARPAEEHAPRAKYLIFFDIRLWKSLRSVLNDLNVSALITDPEYKMQLGEIQASIYPLVVELYVLLDREPEVSVITLLSTQLFTTPSIATAMMRGEAFTRYLATLYTLFTMQRVGPPSSIHAGRVVLSTSMFRNRRLAQLFHELEYLMNRNTDKALVAGNPLRIMQTADFLSLFQSLAPLRRQVDKHVEYESESWIFFFTTIPLVLQLAHSVAQGVLYSPHDSVLESVRLVSGTLQKWAYIVLGRLLGGESSRLRVYSSEYAGVTTSCELSGLSVADDLMSLHHPVHALLSWLIEYGQFSTVEEMRSCILNENARLSAETGINEASMAALLFDNTLRTMAFLSEIHVGLWVRNGYTVRSQLHHYRESTLRDLAYARDVFFAQVGLVCLAPNAAFLQLLQRWNMMNWFNDPLFDDSQRWYMLEEFLHTLTFLLVDRVHLQGLTDQEVKRQCLNREIVQCLAFGPMSYSEVVKHVPDTMATDEEFDMALSQCANFRPPRGLRDVGVYSLKTELLSQFDAHFTYFNAARIDEAEKAILERRVALENLPEDFVHVSPLASLQGPWIGLGNYTRTIAFARFIYDLVEKLLENIRHPQAESLLGKVVHLLIMAALDSLQKTPEQLAILASQKTEGMFDTLPELVSTPEGSGLRSIRFYLCRIIAEPVLSSLHTRTWFLLDRLHEIDPNFEIPDRVAGNVTHWGESQTTETEPERKKRLAKAAQDRVLNEFKEQQRLFASQNNDDAPDEEMYDAVEGTDGAHKFPGDQCVMCRMPDREDSIFGLMTYSCVVRVLRDLPPHPAWVHEGYAGPPGSMDVEQPDEDLSTDKMYGPAFPVSHSRLTPAVQGCGHGMHYNCFKDFQRSQQTRALTSPPRAPHERIASGEFLCPLCKGLNNSFMPVLWLENKLSAETYLEPSENVPEDVTKYLSIRLPGFEHQQNTDALVQSGIAGLSARFGHSFVDQDFSESFSSNVRTVLLAQMLRIKDVCEVLVGTSKPPELFGLGHVYNTITGTVSTLEVALRGQKHANPLGGLVVDQLPTKTMQFLRVLMKYATTLTGFIVSGCFRIQETISDSRLYNPLDPGDALFLNPFSKLVEGLLYSAPAYDIKPVTILRTLYGAALAQVLFNVGNMNDITGLAKLPSAEPSPELSEELLKWTTAADPRHTLAILQRHSTLFLRKAAILIFGLCGNYDADDFACMMNLPEHDRLSMYLGIPPLDEVLLGLSGQTPEGIAARQVAARRVRFVGFEYPGVYRLLRLPQRLDAFFNLPDTKVPMDPAVCLFCGAIVPTQANQGYGRLGSCNRHLETCTHYYGMFLLPRRNVILLLLGDGRGMFCPAPYLDAHGEPDEGMRRERPHYLQPMRYDALVRQMWLENGIFSFTLRKLDQYADIGGWETL